MRTVIIEANQSLRDVAITNYGTLEALDQLILLNEDSLTNDKEALVALGIDFLSDTAFYIDVALEVGSKVTIDDQSKLIKQSVVRELNTPQTKYTK